MQDHQHTIGEVFNLQEKLDAKAGKNHTHEQYAEKDHTHNYAAKSHTHKNYAAADHTHPEFEHIAQTLQYKANTTDIPTRQPQAAIVLQDGDSLDIDAFNPGEMVQVICTNTDKVVHIKDYFKSELPRKFNCQNIVIAPHKSFAARIYRTDLQAFILLDGILFE